MQKRKPNTQHISVDVITAALLQAIANVPENDVDKLIELAHVDPKDFADFAKAIGQQDRPEVKAIIQAAKRRANKPRP